MRKQKAGTKLSITYAVFVILMITAAAVIFFRYSRDTVHNDGVSNLIQTTAATMEQIDNRLTNMEQASVDVLTNAHFLELWVEFTESWNQETGRNVKRILVNAYKNKSDIRRVAVYDKTGSFICTGNTEAEREEVASRVAYIEDKYSFNVADSRVFLGPAADFWEPSTKGTVITEIKPIKTPSKEIVGYIEVQQNYFYLRNICDVKWSGYDLNTMVFIGDQADLFYADMTWKQPKEKIRYFAELTEQYVKAQDTGEEIVTMASSNYYPCRTVIVLPESILYKSLRNTIQGISLVTLLLIAFTILYILFVTKKIMRPIDTFVKRMQGTKLENFTEHQATRDMDWETMILVTAFEDMAARLRESMEREKQMADVQTKTLFGILQSEISPHFMYNTLGSIANMCENGEREEAANACYCLSEIMRYASDYTTVEVTWQEELENLKAYMAIMKSRYRQRLDYEITVDGNLDYFMLPKVTFQPIVENAIKYSLLESEHVFIQIYVVEFDGYAIVEIKDNGCGVTKEAVELVRSRIETFYRDHGSQEITDNLQFGGMGLSGTLIRLSIFFGEGFSYEILGQNDTGGTTIVLKMKLE